MVIHKLYDCNIVNYMVAIFIVGVIIPIVNHMFAKIKDSLK